MLTKQISVAIILCSVFVANKVQANSGAATIYGRLTPENVKKFMSEHENSVLKTVTIMESPGGSGLEVINFGQWLADRKVDIRVVGLCASACANFVFTAGVNKVIAPGGMIVWHGSAEQKNIRQRQDEFLQLSHRVNHAVKTGESVDAALRKGIFEVRQGTSAFELIEKQRVAQARFFKSIATDERITRLGQEPHDYGVEWWTVTPEVMTAFGIKNVSFPPGYGTAQYLRENAVLTSMRLRGDVMSFEKNANNIAPIFLATPSDGVKILSLSEFELRDEK